MRRTWRSRCPSRMRSANASCSMVAVPVSDSASAERKVSSSDPARRASRCAAPGRAPGRGARVEDAPVPVERLQRLERVSGEAGTRRRSRPRRSRRRARHSSSARRRASGSTPPVGNWCDGVTKARRASRTASDARFSPCSSTGTCTISAPCAVAQKETRVARLLDHDALARVDQHADREVDGLLRTAHDEDLLRRAGDAATASSTRRAPRAAPAPPGCW